MSRQKRYHFRNLYLTTTVSIALVLFLIGVETVLVLGARELVGKIRENVDMTIVLRKDITPEQQEHIEKLLSVAKFARDVQFVSEQQALNDHISQMGEDPTEYLGYNPLSASYVVKLSSDYVQKDSIAAIAGALKSFDSVSEVLYAEDVVTALDNNINKYSVVIVSLAAILLLVAVSLIITTIRLQVYSRRFLINTMKLVGATSWAIKAPIVRKNIVIGLISGVLALCMVAGLIYYSQHSLGLELITLSWQNAAIVTGVVLLSGVMITLLSSIVATNRYIRMTTNDLYFI